MKRRARTTPRAATPAATRKTVTVRSKNTAAAARQRDRGPWIESPQWDGFWMLSGLWLFGLLVVARLGNLTAIVFNGQFVLAMLLWGGHTLSPLLTAWGNADFRALMGRSKRQYVYAPGLLFVGCVVCGVLGDLTPWQLGNWQQHLNPRYLLFYGFLVWNTWHFAAQHFGVLSLYRRLAGQTRSQDRVFDRTFAILMVCGLLPLAWVAQASRWLLGPLVDYLGTAAGQGRLATAVLWVSLGLTLLAVVREMCLKQRSLPRALYLVSIGLQPVVSALSQQPYEFFYVYSISHWMVAIALSARVYSQQGAAVTSAGRYWPSLGRVNRWHLAHVAVLLLLSVPLYYLLYVPTTLWGQVSLPLYYGQRLGQLPTLFGLLSGMYFGLTFVHFMYDRFVYTFRKPEVYTAIGVPLLQRLTEEAT